MFAGSIWRWRTRGGRRSNGVFGRVGVGIERVPVTPFRSVYRYVPAIATPADAAASPRTNVAPT
jgi:hypothetical protein